MKKIPVARLKSVSECPYCKGADFVKSGFRVKKHEKIQVFFCNLCQKKFTPLITKGKSYPVSLILQSLMWFNRFYEPDRIAEYFNEKYGLKITPATIQNWVKEYQVFTPFQRMREFLKPKLEAEELNFKEMIIEQRLFHQQIYDFKYHRFKTNLVLQEDFKNFKQRALQEFLELIIAECPHQVFRESRIRASEFRNVFNLDEVRIVKKRNRANDMARFVMQAVGNNKERHRCMQDFMLFCDSTTLAVEVPVLLDKEDIDHFQMMLNFNVPLEIGEKDVITGHIDILQLRNGIAHIIDFKPSAAKAKPIEQLTIYALALSRLTGLRLHSFKCAWFDEDDYFEFFPLHVVYKKAKNKSKKLTMLSKTL